MGHRQAWQSNGAFEMLLARLPTYKERNDTRKAAIKRAYDSVTPQEQAILDSMAKTLAGDVPRLGPHGALEVIAAIGRLIGV